MDMEDDQQGKESCPFREMTYVQIIGNVKSQHGQKNIMVLDICKIEDMNQITTHILSIIHAKLKLDSLKQPVRFLIYFILFEFKVCFYYLEFCW